MFTQRRTSQRALACIQVGGDGRGREVAGLNMVYLEAESRVLVW